MTVFVFHSQSSIEKVLCFLLLNSLSKDLHFLLNKLVSLIERCLRLLLTLRNWPKLSLVTLVFLRNWLNNLVVRPHWGVSRGPLRSIPVHWFVGWNALPLRVVSVHRSYGVVEPTSSSAGVWVGKIFWGGGLPSNHSVCFSSPARLAGRAILRGGLCACFVWDCLMRIQVFLLAWVLVGFGSSWFEDFWALSMKDPC